MKLRQAMISLVLALAAGCDTMEQDIDGKTLSINNDAAYFLPNTDGFIDLPARVVAPGKIRVEITGSTRHGELKDLGKGLLQYSPFKRNSPSNDSFRFRVLSDDNRVLGDDSIGIIIPKDTTQLPCKYVYTRNDTVRNVTGAVTVDVAQNDYSCSGTLTISINVGPQYGTATMVGNKIKYTPNNTFVGSDKILYKAVSSDPTLIPGYAWLQIYSQDSVVNNCTSLAVNDLFYKPLGDTASTALDVLANDVLCESNVNAMVTLNPHYGTAYYDSNVRKIWYKSKINHDDTLKYQMCQRSGCTYATVVVKRN